MPAGNRRKQDHRAEQADAVPNGDFYQLIDYLTPEEKALGQEGADLYETKVQPVIKQVLVR